MTPDDQDRAIAEALGWTFRRYGDHTQWAHPFHGGWRLITPRLTSETTLGRAMCYDALQWLLARDNWRVSRPFTAAALEAAMIKELGL